MHLESINFYIMFFLSHKTLEQYGIQPFPSDNHCYNLRISKKEYVHPWEMINHFLAVFYTYGSVNVFSPNTFKTKCTIPANVTWVTLLLNTLLTSVIHSVWLSVV